MSDAADVVLPNWVVALVGRLTLEREALAHQVAALQPTPQPEPTEEE